MAKRAHPHLGARDVTEGICAQTAPKFCPRRSQVSGPGVEANHGRVKAAWRIRGPSACCIYVPFQRSGRMIAGGPSNICFAFLFSLADTHGSLCFRFACCLPFGHGHYCSLSSRPPLLLMLWTTSQPRVWPTSEKSSLALFLMG